MSQKGIKEKKFNQSMLLDGFERMLVGLGKFCDRMERIDARIEALESGQKTHMMRRHHRSPKPQQERPSYVRWENLERDVVDQKIGQVKWTTPSFQQVYDGQLQIQKKSLTKSEQKQKTEKENSQKEKQECEEILRMNNKQLQLGKSKRVIECTKKYEASSCEKRESWLQDLSSLSEGKEIFDPGEWICINSQNQMKYKLQPCRDGISNDNSNELNLVDSRTNPFEERGNDTIQERTSKGIMHRWRGTNVKLGDQIQIPTSLNLHRIVVFDPGGFRPTFKRTPTLKKPNLRKAQLYWLKHIFSLPIHVIRAFDQALIFRLGYLDQPLNPLFLALRIAHNLVIQLLYNGTRPLL